MGWFILLGITVVVMVVGLFVGVIALSGSGTRIGGFATFIGAPVLFIGITLLMASHTVENGHIGIVKQFGSIKGTTGEGLVWVAPWKNLAQVSVQNELRTYLMDDRSESQAVTRDVSAGASVSKDSQPVYLVEQVNYSLVRSGAVDLYRETGGQYVERILDPAVFQVTKEITAGYKATDFAANRERIRLKVEKALQQEVGTVVDKNGKQIQALRINSIALKNVDFTDALSQAIEQTVEAEQQAKRETARVDIATAEAAQAVAKATGVANSNIAEARGEAQSNILRAEADAKANRLRSKSLSRILVQNNAIDKLNPDVSIIYCSAGVICVPNAVASVPVTGK